MIRKTSKEIYDEACQSAHVYNSDFANFFTCINLLNNTYRSLYTEIAKSDSNYYIKEFEITKTVQPLPADLFMIKTVAFKGLDNRLHEIARSPEHECQYGTYRIENNVFTYYGQDLPRPIVIKYVPECQTITAPEDPIKCEVDPSSISSYGAMTEDGFYFKKTDDAKYYYYDFGTAAEEEVSTYVEQTDTYLGRTLSLETKINEETQQYEQHVYWGSDDVSGIFAGPALIKSIVCHSPYCMITYQDGTIYIMNNWTKTNWNIKESTGHLTLGQIVALHTNDRTGRGCLYIDKDDGLLYLCSFVPDTVLNYPSNALFYLLSCIMANKLLSLSGINDQYLQVETSNAEKEFFDELNQNRAAPTRIHNTFGKRGRY